jgi:ATP adenylyltransferase
MKVLWAPWRRKYVTSEAVAPGCIFCRALERATEADSLVVHVAPLSFVVVNLFPYNSGHLMIAPRRHVGSLAAATPAELAEVVELARRLEDVLTRAYKPHGLNLGMNLGRTAGAGVEDHIHLHVVPRWNGDANFMKVVADTCVIPEDPLEACRRLRGFFAEPDTRSL